MKRKPRILLIEDNVSFGAMIYDDLVQIGKTSWMNSESDFQKYWTFIEAEPPDLAVVDVMLAWTHPIKDDTDTSSPEDDFLYPAGLRCAEKFASNEQTRHVRIIFYTVVPQSDVKERLAELRRQLPNIVYLQKPSDLASAVSEIVRLMPEENLAVR